LISLAEPATPRAPISAAPAAGLANTKAQAPESTIRTFLNFAVGGGVIAVFGAVLLATLVKAGVSALAAQGIQLALTLFLNFIYNYKITWRRRPRTSLPRQIAWFILTRGFTQLASWAGFAALTKAGVQYELANAVCLAAATAINFITSDTLVFRRPRARMPLSEPAPDDRDNVEVSRIVDRAPSGQRKDRADRPTLGVHPARVPDRNPLLGGGAIPDIAASSYEFKEASYDVISVSHRGVGHHLSDLHSGARTIREDRLAAREITPGALRDRYEIPTVTFSRNEMRGIVLSLLLIPAWIFWQVARHDLVIIICVLPAFAFRLLSWALSWLDKPVAEYHRSLDRLHVAVAVPVYNEDPALLDRCLYALMNQSRPPNLIWVVDDGSTEDYSALKSYWTGVWPDDTEIRWMRQPNQGKRRAHAMAFDASPEADILVTVDSDTTLEYRAIEEGLKPFRSREVSSVAGIEMGFNAYTNFLTRLQCSLQLFAQAVIGAAWSVAGDMYTNRGPFALYRASVIREFMPVYRDETFLHRRVILGDDSLLALCASSKGRTVQQLTAFGLTMWPESLGHHIRQRVRWARGRAVRNLWRIKYRPLRSYCWWFTVTGIYGFFLSIGILLIAIAYWPLDRQAVFNALEGFILLSILNSSRTLCFTRTDETWLDRFLLVLIRPAAALWSSIVLARIVRLWGTLTLLRQGWTTRQDGAELVFTEARRSEAREVA
jgi:hyaluronan synthase